MRNIRRLRKFLRYLVVKIGVTTAILLEATSRKIITKMMEKGFYLNTSKGPKKIYFAGAIRGDRIAAENMREIVSFMKSLGHIVLSEHVAQDNPKAVFSGRIGKKEKDVTERDIQLQDVKDVDESTHLVAEVTGVSTGTGIEIGHAEAKVIPGKRPKKILCLYLKEREASVSAMIRGMTKDRYPNVTVASYSTLKEAKEIILEFLNEPF